MDWQGGACVLVTTSMPDQTKNDRLKFFKLSKINLNTIFYEFSNNIGHVEKLEFKLKILNQRTARAREEFASNEGHQNRAQP